jgi:hypothetical protein
LRYKSDRVGQTGAWDKKSFESINEDIAIYYWKYSRPKGLERKPSIRTQLISHDKLISNAVKGAEIRFIDLLGKNIF